MIHGNSEEPRTSPPSDRTEDTSNASVNLEKVSAQFSTMEVTETEEPEVRSKRDYDPYGNPIKKLNQMSVREEKHHLCRLIDQFNEQPEAATEEELLTCLHQLYGKGLTHCQFSGVPLQPVAQASSVNDHDLALLTAIRDQKSTSHKKRSLAIARMTCWLVSDRARLDVLEHFSQYLCGEDLAYIARHSRPNIASWILENHLPKMSAEAILAIADAHPELVARFVMDKHCLIRECEWPQLLKLCQKSPELTEAVFNKTLALDYISYRHRAVLATQSLEKAEALQAELISEIFNHFDAPCSYDEQAAWRLIMCHRNLAEEWLGGIKDSMSETHHPIMMAEILSRYPELRTAEGMNIREVFNDRDAASLLLNRNLISFMDLAHDYIHREMTDEQRLELLNHHPQLGMFILPMVQSLELTGLSNLMNSYTSTAGDMLTKCFLKRLGPQAQRELSTQLTHTAALAMMRSRKNEWQFYQHCSPYPEAFQLLVNPGLIQQLEQLNEKQIRKLQADYPSLIALRKLLAIQNPLLSVSNDMAVYASSKSLPLVMEILNDPAFSDEEKLKAACFYQQSLMTLLEDPESYLQSPEQLFVTEALATLLMTPNQKRSAVRALEMGYLDHTNGLLLYDLCCVHPLFADALQNRPELLSEISLDLLMDLCRQNPSFCARMKTDPTLLGIWQNIVASCAEEPAVLEQLDQPTFPVSEHSSMHEQKSFGIVEMEQFLGMSERLLEDPAVAKAVNPEFFNLPQSEILSRYTDRLKPSGVCRGLCLDYASWQVRHPELHPTEYLRKVDKYCRAENHWRHHKSLPERLDFLQRQHRQFISPGEEISYNDQGETYIDTAMLEALLREHKALFLTQKERHSCIIQLWDVPDTRGAQQVVVFDPNEGMYCFIGCSSDESWKRDTHLQVDEAIKNGLLKYGIEVGISAHQVNVDAVANQFATPVRYRGVDEDQATVQKME